MHAHDIRMPIIMQPAVTLLLFDARFVSCADTCMRVSMRASLCGVCVYINKTGDTCTTSVCEPYHIKYTVFPYT